MQRMGVTFCDHDGTIRLDTVRQAAANTGKGGFLYLETLSIDEQYRTPDSAEKFADRLNDTFVGATALRLLAERHQRMHVVLLHH
ncbi:hypothetical protein SARC_06837 [Sphaeroforma arctica JP610]|uniref:Uncharacterized protein n=1 Tax=Sphaeroforma arctica JP610 TaxID=667725 RepID=A0A0L0FXX3_9EUKA|nr:hypothetical protein SARC_06837 [Sphaeroforma arctica JP610]KNC80813.1 hypothetical protein SARC_06837 [Sphaeroforma arctica JP610]|eukprot:XP_014154715.1 hypothetical protein SARC_06837 [Sphaeroforma arctica JP610]